MTTTFDCLSLSLEDGVATIELRRPDSLNALNGVLGPELRDAVAQVASDDAVRCVMITGAGRAFSTGADLKDTTTETTESGRPDLAWVLRNVYNPLVLELRGMDKPAVAAVNGPTVGVAVGIALACDFVLASRSAYFLLSFVNVGLSLDGGVSAFATARAGLSRATEFSMLGDRLPAETAAEWGLINSVHDDEELLDAARALSVRLANGARQAQASTKKLLNDHAYPNLAEQLELEAVLQQRQGEGDEFVEGVMAFLQKRPPQFSNG